MKVGSGFFLITLLLLAPSGLAIGEALEKPSTTPRVIISTDLGGSDEDDIQSLIHYLTYADSFDTEGIISSPPGAGRSRDILRVLDTYASDWQWLRTHADFPHARELKPLVKQGAVAPAPPRGYTAPTQGSEWIIQCARKEDPRPLWVLVWGSITDLAQALHDAPEISDRLRVHFIASWNLRQDPHAFSYIDAHHKDLFMIQNDTTFRGWYRGGNQRDDLGNQSFVAAHIRGHGALGDLFSSCHAGGVTESSIKMGDSPTVAYLLRNSPDDPTLPHWGGQFVKMKGRPNWFVDTPDPKLGEPPHAGAKTVSKWRDAYLRDWQTRMDWCIPIKRTGWSLFQKMEDTWFQSQEARKIANHLRSHQTAIGGWTKNRGTFQFPFHGDREIATATFDNDATVDEIRFMAKIAKLTGDSHFLHCCLRGIDFVLQAQDRKSGGWPQEYPPELDYGRHITYNDDAIVNVMELLLDITNHAEPFDSIIDDKRRAQCEAALKRGVSCLLNTQVIQNGRATVWGAQHDESSLLPCMARSYEHPTLSGQESSKILQFLMKIPSPNPDITAAIHSGAAWFTENSISGFSLLKTKDKDVILLPDDRAPLLWSRFYELGSNRPTFSDHDGVIKYRFSEISKGRRWRYSWFSTRGSKLLTKYRQWCEANPENPERLARFEGIEKPLRKHSAGVQDREIAVRDYASVANVSVATRIDYPAKPPSLNQHVIICPGGDYQYLRLRKAHAHAEALAKKGLDVTVLKYRTPRSIEGVWSPEADPVEDLFELMRQVKKESSPSRKLGIFGLEAGGHLALIAAIHHQTLPGGIRPDFVAAADAPVDSLPLEWLGTLSGENVNDHVLSDFYSISLHVNEDVCPLFLSYSRERFRTSADDLSLTLKRRGISISMDRDHRGQKLPMAFEKASPENQSE